MSDLLIQLKTAFPDLPFESEVALAPFTSVKIGGPAEVLVAIEATANLAAVVKFCHEHDIPVTILGWGANTLIADRGLRGLVIRNLTKELTIEPDSTVPDTTATNREPITVEPRHQTTDAQRAFSSLEYQELEGTERVSVIAASGWPLPTLLNSLLSQGITGLQWYSRIPATLGGAIVNNIHGGTHFLSECVESVRVVTPANEIKTLTAAECNFAYDYSRFHTSKEVLLDARLRLWRGDVTKARATVGEWAQRKSHQPQRSLGCVFQNISAEEQQRLQLPTPSVGYIIDQVLHLKGTKIGGVQISNTHAAFIENVGDATAKDYLDLAVKIHREARTALSLHLQPEIFFRGFEPSETAELLRQNSP